MRFLFRSLTGLFLFAVTIGLLTFAGRMVFDAVQSRAAQEDRRPAARERIAAVNVVQVELVNVSPVLVSFGEVRSRRTLELRAAASGTIVYLADGFEDGGRVEAQDLLARIDPADALAALAVVETDLGEAEATLAEADRALLLAGDDLASAREQADLRGTALARSIDLRDRGVGTGAAVEAAELAASAARQAILSRRQSLANAESQLDRAITGLARQNIALAEAKRALAETEVYADFAGTLSDVSAVEGGLVTNNERLARIVDTQALEVAFRVSTPQYARLLDAQGALIGADVAITLDILGVDLETSGRITRESAAVGEGQTGRMLFAQIAAPKGLRPGDFVLVGVTEPELRGVAILPAASVGNDGTVLVLGDEDRLLARDVQVLRRQGDDVIVAGDGLAGLSLVAARAPLLGAGIRVRPLDRPEPGAARAEPEAEEMVTLTTERRERLIAFIENNNRMPEDVKDRMLTALQQDQVPAQIVERLESRMGG